MDSYRRPPRRKPGGNVDGFINAPHRTGSSFSDLSSLSVGANKSVDSKRIGRFDQAEGFNRIRTPIAPNNAAITGKPSPNPDQNFVGKHSANPELGQPLPSAEPRRRRHPGTSKRSRIKTIAKRTSLVMASLVVIGGGFLLFKGYWQLRHIFSGGSSAIAASPGRINILLLGVGGVGHDGPDLTDTILLASIDPINNKAVLLSVPRDLWTKMPNDYVAYYSKINAAYESGKYSYLGEQSSSDKNQKAIDAGFSAVNKTVGQVLDVPINYDVLVDFRAFEQGVNAVGGITINVPTELYDPTIAWENHWNPVIAEPGLQSMNGAKALLYARSRETSSDFARTQRQRAILVALKKKVLTLGTFSNPFKISSLMSAFGDNVRTNMSITDASSLYNIMKRITNHNIQSVGLADPPNNFLTTSDEDGESVVEPVAGLFDYKPIQSYVHTILQNGYVVKENASIEVLNGTKIPGEAQELADMLKFYGYKVSHVGDAPTSTYTNNVLVDLTHGQDSHTRDALEKRLNESAITALPDQSIKSNGANFVIIVGQ